MSSIEQKALERAIGEARSQAVHAAHHAFDHLCRQIGVGNWPAHERAMAGERHQGSTAAIGTAAAPAHEHGVTRVMTPGAGASPTVIGRETAGQGDPSHDSGEMPPKAGAERPHSIAEWLKGATVTGDALALYVELHDALTAEGRARAEHERAQNDLKDAQKRDQVTDGDSEDATRRVQDVLRRIRAQVKPLSAEGVTTT